MESEKKPQLSEMMAPYVMAGELIMARVAGDSAKFYDHIRKAK
jgi:hypothetical protein